MEEQEKDIQDYIITIRKRKSAIIAIFSVVMFLSTVVAFILPAIYKSSATILIEQQEIPPELVMSTVTSYAAERIQTIQARVMSRTNLMKIVEKFGLYVNERKIETTEEIMERMQDDVSLDIISADVVDPRTGRASVSTIAFSISYQGESPTKVQSVTNELTSLYLSENLTSRAQKATDTSVFFKEETERLGAQIDELESKLAEFKQEHANALPEIQSLNMSMLQRKEAELSTIDTALRTLDEKRFYLGGQLAQISPGDSSVPGSAERLLMLQAEYASLSSKYSEEHPDVIKLKGEISTLEQGGSQGSNATVIAEQLALLNTELSEKQQKYTPDHPDVVSLNEKINALNTELKEINNSPVEQHFESNPNNPLYITIQSQLAGVNSEMKSLVEQRKEVLTKIAEIEKSIYSAPQVERQYLVLKRDYDNAVARYQETKAKQMQADVAKQLEQESKGEKFTLIDPAALPEKPVSPNRPAIMFLGFVLALGSGLGFAVVADVISGTVRGAASIKKSLGELPLSVIPYEMNLQDKVKKSRIKKRVVLLFIAFVAFALLFIHFVVSPLDVMWFRMLRKVDILMS